MNWKELSVVSHYKTALAVQSEIKNGNFAGASTGLEELIEAMGRSERRALKSYLELLMVHIIKWKSQPKFRSFSWARTIHNARSEIEEIQEETPSLNNTVIQDIWEKTFLKAQKDAEAEMNQKTDITDLSWKEVFEEEYSIN